MHISFIIGTYKILKLIDAKHFEGPPCGSFGNEHDTYNFASSVNLNDLGRHLLEKKLLFTRYSNRSSLVLWDGRHTIENVWSDAITDEKSGYQYVVDDETLNFKSSLQSR